MSILVTKKPISILQFFEVSDKKSKDIQWLILWNKLFIPVTNCILVFI